MPVLSDRRDYTLSRTKRVSSRIQSQRAGCTDASHAHSLLMWRWCPLSFPIRHSCPLVSLVSPVVDRGISFPIFQWVLSDAPLLCRKDGMHQHIIYQPPWLRVRATHAIHGKNIGDTNFVNKKWKIYDNTKVVINSERHICICTHIYLFVGILYSV